MNKSIKIIFRIAASAVIYSSCSIGQQYTSPRQKMPMDFGAGIHADSSNLVKWFDIFRDTTLQNIIKTTLENNNDLASASSRVEEARYQLDVIRVNTMPSFGYQIQTGGGSAGNEALKVGGGLNSSVNRAFGLLNWELDLWGKLKRSTEAARAQLLAQEAIRNALKVSLVAEAANAYFLLCDLDNRLIIAKRTVESRKESSRIIHERFEKGYVAELDKLQAMQQEALVAAIIPNIKRQIAQVENTLNVLMARMPQPVSRGQQLFTQTLTPSIPVGLPSQLLVRRPDIVAAEQSFRAQFERIGIAQASMFPTVSLTGLMGFASPQLNSLVSGGFVANGIAGFTGPIFQFNQNKNRVMVERKRSEQAQLQYEQTIIKAFADVNNALVQNQTFTEEFTRRKEQADAATKAYVLSKARYDYGYTSYLEVLIQENSLFDAELQVSNLYQQRLNAMVSLYRSLGGGWE